MRMSEERPHAAFPSRLALAHPGRSAIQFAFGRRKRVLMIPLRAWYSRILTGLRLLA